MPITYEGKEYRVIQYLTSVRRSKEKLSEIEAHLEELRHNDLLKAARYDFSSSGSSYGDAIPDAIIRNDPKKVSLECSKAICLREIEVAGEICSQTKACRGLWLHYVEGKTWPAVARKLDCSKRTALRLRRQGIEELYYRMPMEQRHCSVFN